MRRLLVIGLVGCGSQRPPEGVVVVPPPPPTPASYAAPTLGALPEWRLVCEGLQTPLPAKLAIYDYAPTPLYPVRRGPRVADRTRAGRPRTLLHLEEALSKQSWALSMCWKWASATGTPDTTIDVAFTVTPLGKTTAPSVTGPPASAELVACVRETFAEVLLDEVSTRTTRMQTRIAFVRVNQPPWPHTPVRPGPNNPQLHDERTCTPMLVDAIDQLASPITYTVDDRDSSRDPPKPGVPTVTFGCAPMRKPEVNKAHVRRAFESNRGEFQRCYADARDRDPKLTGNVTVQITFDHGATPATVTSVGAGDIAFHQCLRKAANDVWLGEVTSSRQKQANVHFELAEATDAPDHERELAVAVDAVNAAKTDRARCDARTDVVAALARIAPWLDDARVLAATRDLTTFASKLPDADARACLARVDKTLQAIGGSEVHPHRDPALLRWSWLERIEAVLPAAPYVEWGAGLRLFHAATIAMTAPRHREGITALQAIVAERTPWSEIAEDVLDRYELPRAVESRICR